MMENNKLIAEFMGLSIKEGVCYYTDADDMFPMGIEVEDPYLPYHTSWDWLMPVVEKIYQLDSNADFFGSINLEATYKEVVEFIKEHNDAQRENN